MRVICIMLSPGVDVQHLAECTLRFSPQVAVGEHWIFLEVGKCKNLYSEETVFKRLRVMLQRFGLFGQLAIAGDLPTALSFARHRTKSLNDLPVNALKDFFDPFRYNSSLDKMLIHLEKLGIYTIEDFIKLPRRTLVTRFGKEGLWAAQRLTEADRIVWPHFKVQEKIHESLIVSTAPAALEALLFYIKTLTDRVASRLLGRGERVSKFSLRLHQEKFSHVQKPTREFIFELPLAQSAGVSLLSIIRERLNVSLSREPLQSEVELVELGVLDTIPLKTSQRDFLNRDEEECEAWAGLIGRLEERLGQGSAFMAQPCESYLPEKSWSRQLPSIDVKNQKNEMPHPLRPLRIFKNPLPLERDGAKLWARNQSWHIQSILGPERLREEWWRLGTERDYYQIQTQSGEKLWVFQRSNQSGLFLHGLFD